MFQILFILKWIYVSCLPLIADHIMSISYDSFVGMTYKKDIVFNLWIFNY